MSLLNLLNMCLVIHLLSFFFQGVLLFPKNDTHNANLLTLYDADGNSGCDLYMDSGNGHFESWPDKYEYFSILEKWLVHSSAIQNNNY